MVKTQDEAMNKTWLEVRQAELSILRDRLFVQIDQLDAVRGELMNQAHKIQEQIDLIQAEIEGWD